MAAKLEVAQPLRQFLELPQRRIRLEMEVCTINLFPHLRRNCLANRTGIFPRGPQTRTNRIGVGRVHGQKSDDIFLCGLAVTLLESRCVSASVDQGLPLVRWLKRKV